jgi:isocitrate dehydrogenase
MTKICVAYGDGIGPEIMTSVISILKAAKVELDYETVDVGEKVYLSGISHGISDDAWNKILQNKILLKGPMTTPLGGGYKSINVTLRKKLGLFANVRPVVSYSPFIKCNAQNMDVVIVRENEEDLYSGIEYQTTENSYVAVKLISETGSRKIIKYAFDYAVSNGRKKVTCITKNNIMKLSDGAFARIFDEVVKDYPQIEHNHMIVDIGSARIASKPETFDVIVTLNLYGDIISDIAAEAAGAVGIAGSANIGGDYAMFEAVHGSAPDIAGQGKANPSGLLSAAIMMLRHLKMHEKANLIENAWLATIEAGVHTADLYSGTGKLVSTTEFTEAVIQNIGNKPNTLKASEKQAGEVQNKSLQTSNHKKSHKVIGCDVYIRSANTKDFHSLQDLQTDNLKLSFIGHKGLVIWPGSPNDSELDMLQLRFISSSEISQSEIIKLQQMITNKNLEIVMVNTLSEYDGKQGFSKGQGE